MITYATSSKKYGGKPTDFPLTSFSVLILYIFEIGHIKNQRI
jgi:hypothetical protein